MSDGGAPGGPARSPGFCSRPLTPDGAVAVGGCGEAAAPLPVSGRTWRELQAWGPAAGERLRARQLGGSCPGGHAAVRPDLGATWRLRSPGPAVPAPAPGEWVRAVGVRGGGGSWGAGSLGAKRFWARVPASVPLLVHIGVFLCTRAPCMARRGSRREAGAVGSARGGQVGASCPMQVPFEHSPLDSFPAVGVGRWPQPRFPPREGAPSLLVLGLCRLPPQGRAALLVQETPRAPLAPAAVPLSLVIRHLLHFFPWKLVRF